VKKWYIILTVFLLAIIIGVVVPVLQGSKVKTYLNEITLHSAVHKVYNDTKGVTSEGSVRLCDANVSYFEKAITNTGLVYRFFKPDVSGLSSVTVTYHDGAEFEIFDAGKTKNNKDLAYIFYSYNGKCICFSTEGYGTYERAYRCASPEGFSGKNPLI
jgi:hypothetical protein